MRVTCASARPTSEATISAEPSQRARSPASRIERQSSSGISISSSAELSDLPCASSASVRVTPPPTTPCEDEVQRAELRQLVADDLARDEAREVRLHPLGGDVAREPRVVARRRTRSARCSTMVPLSPLRRMRDRPQLHVRRPPVEPAGARASRGMKRRRDRQHLARRLRGAAAAGRAVRVQRLDLVADARRLGATVRVRPRRARALRTAPAARLDSRSPCSASDADQVAAHVAGCERRAARSRSATIAPASRARATAPAARVRDLPLADEAVAVAERDLQRVGRADAPVAPSTRDAVARRLGDRHAAEIGDDVRRDVRRPDRGSRRAAAPCTSPASPRRRCPAPW